MRLLIPLPWSVRPGWDKWDHPVCSADCPNYTRGKCSELDEHVGPGDACEPAIDAALDSVCFTDPDLTPLPGQPEGKGEEDAREVLR
jgi:hypothetical protein